MFRLVAGPAASFSLRFRLDHKLTATPANLRLDPETLGEIRQALNSGKEVITHTDPISVPGWQGAGYVITDMETGAGAWKIGGGFVSFPVK